MDQPDWHWRYFSAGLQSILTMHSTHLFALRDGVENAEIRLRIRPGASTPLPTAVIGCQISVDKILHEVLEDHYGYSFLAAQGN